MLEEAERGLIAADVVEEEAVVGVKDPRIDPFAHPASVRNGLRPTAIMRGLSREVLSLVAWGAAAVAAFYAIFSEPVRKQATDLLKPYIGENDVVVTIAVAGAVFLVVLIVLSIIGAKISDALLETGAGPIDRTLGFFYGLARGLVLMMAVFIFYVWLVPRDKIDNAVRDAMTLPLVTSVSSFAVDTLLTVGLMGPDLADDLQAKIGNPSTLSTRGDAEAPAFVKSTRFPDGVLEGLVLGIAPVPPGLGAESSSPYGHSPGLAFREGGGTARR